MAPPSCGLVRWIAAGTLPDAPDMRPSVTSATWNPLSCRTPSAGVSLCNSGILLDFGPLEADHGDKVAVQLAALERILQLVLVVEDESRSLMT